MHAISDGDKKDVMKQWMENRLEKQIGQGKPYLFFLFNMRVKNQRSFR